MRGYISANPSDIINSIGLLCDIIGAYMLWRYGLPERISKTGHGSLLLVGVDEKEKAKAKQYDLRSNIGFGLLIFGFTLQLISNFVRP